MALTTADKLLNELKLERSQQQMRFQLLQEILQLVIENKVNNTI